SAPLRRHPLGRALLLRPFVLSSCSGGREHGFGRGWPETGACGSARPINRTGSWICRFARGLVRVRCQVRRCDRDRADSCHAVPSREEPAVGAAHAGELRGGREERPVIVIPAIDLRGGRCVRLHQGRSDRETVFADDPVAAALHWKALGAERLHVVDLDGAFAGEPRQSPLVTKIVAAGAAVPVGVGGGLRTLKDVETALETGARWAVVGTRAALDCEFLAEICRRHAGRIIVAVDARGDRVAVKGWTEVIDETVVEVGRRARDAGAAALLYTAVNRC